MACHQSTPVLYSLSVVGMHPGPVNKLVSRPVLLLTNNREAQEMLRITSIVLFLLCPGLWWQPSPAVARAAPEYDGDKYAPTTILTQTPAYGTVSHHIGRIVLCVANNGTFGDGFAPAMVDYFTGDQVLSCEYPKGTDTKYLYAGAFWIGAVVGRDTLVSAAATGWSWVEEFSPDAAPFGEIKKRSTLSIDPTLAVSAVSEEDYIMKYCDTLTAGVGLDYFGRPHNPLDIEVTQSSYAWSYTYAEDFVLFDYSVKNIGVERLNDVYMGFYVDADVYFGQSNLGGGYSDDICGFVEAFPANYNGCDFMDTVNIAWIADNDGDPNNGGYDEQSVPHVTGIRIVRTPADSLDVSFNWWISNTRPELDFGPRERSGVGRWTEEFRDYGTGGLGTPEGDVNLYYIMRNMEFDYDQIYTATISPADSLWLCPNLQYAGDYADGFDTRYLLSFGPFDIDPGETLPISFAYVAGENFHIDPNNYSHLPNNPDAYYENIDFSDLASNAAWAGRIYDNPGVDTDGDGKAGKVRICCSDSVAYSLDDIEDISTIDDFDENTCEIIWYEGDGVPDFRGASPPPSPDYRIEPSVGCLRVRINGAKSETAMDLFSRIEDFEGYRIYIGLDNRESSFSLVASFDREDYNKLVWTGSDFVLFDLPYSLDSLRCLYGSGCDDTTFHPLNHSRDNPLYYGDSVFCFLRQDYNSECDDSPGSIRKTYPDQPYPSSLNPDSAEAGEVTDDGYLKYFEYEFVIDNLLPTIPYWVNVTAFDFGSPESDLTSLESSVTVGATMAYPNTSALDAVEQSRKVYVYPNPYRSDAGYRNAGFEGRLDRIRPDDRVRAVHFANLPPKCTIRIYSLDGDLIREFEHDMDPNDPTASHDYWDLITRNTQLVVSGLYYWVVDTPGGKTQIGKLVIIM